MKNNEPWVEQAICRTVDPELWFPEKGGDNSVAKRICMGCPVRQLCLEFALQGNEAFGIFGGKSERERRRMRQEGVAA